MKNILIVDDDLGFVFWLGSALFSADYQPWPACHLSDVPALAGKSAVAMDLLIVNPSLPGVSMLTALLRRSQAQLKVIRLRAEGKVKLPDIQSRRRMPDSSGESAKREWLAAVRQTLIHNTRAA
jgi:hypothetical protein